jgi:hypothetical protein
MRETISVVNCRQAYFIKTKKMEKLKRRKSGKQKNQVKNRNKKKRMKKG